MALKVVQRSLLPEASPEGSPEASPDAREQAQLCEFMVSLSATHPNIVSTYKILVSGSAKTSSFDSQADSNAGSAPDPETPPAPASLSEAVDNGTLGCGSLEVLRGQWRKLLVLFSRPRASCQSCLSLSFFCLAMAFRGGEEMMSLSAASHNREKNRREH